MQKNKKKIIILYLLLLFGLGFLLLPLKGEAATLSLDSSSSQYKTGDTFIVNVRLGVEKKESINAVEAHIQFPPSLLKAKDFSTGNSILTFIDNPIIDSQKGIVSFAGIVPGGYSGRIPGNPGPDALLGKIIFQAKAGGKVTIQFSPSSRILLNNGKGTPAPLATQRLILNIQKQETGSKVKSLEDQWRENLQNDKTPPEDFQPVIVKINNKYYLNLNAKDKESGIDYYLVREKSLAIHPPVAAPLSWDCAALPFLSCWHKVRNLYLLKDQALRSVIEVKAVDKAGNIKSVILQPQNKHLIWYTNAYVWLIIMLLLFILFYSFHLHAKHH